MSSLTTIPAEIRLQIWHLVVPEEVEIPDGSLEEYSSHPLPANPKRPLLLISRNVRKETSMVRSPILCVTVTSTSWQLILWEPHKNLLQTTERIRITGVSQVLPEDLTEGNYEDLERVLYDFWRRRVTCRYRAVQTVYLKSQENRSSQRLDLLSRELVSQMAKSKAEEGCSSQGLVPLTHELLFNVSGLISSYFAYLSLSVARNETSSLVFLSHYLTR